MVTRVMARAAGMRRTAAISMGVVWLVVAAGLLAVDAVASATNLSWVARSYWALTLTASPICFALYALDKRRAVRDQPRIAERTLHCWALCGGWPGAMLGGQLVRHKTQKLSFRAVLWLIVLLHVAAVTAWLVW